MPWLRWWYLKLSINVNKGKSPKFPFLGITSPYSYFQAIWIFALIQQEAKHDQEKLSAEQKWEVSWQSPAMFCLFRHQAKIQICCTVKLIPWNVVIIWATFKDFTKVCSHLKFGKKDVVWIISKLRPNSKLIKNCQSYGLDIPRSAVYNFERRNNLSYLKHQILYSYGEANYSPYICRLCLT